MVLLSPTIKRFLAKGQEHTRDDEFERFPRLSFALTRTDDGSLHCVVEDDERHQGDSRRDIARAPARHREGAGEHEG